MSPAQRSMLFGEWKKCWKAIVIASGGQTAADEREVRHAVTLKAIGKAKSWGAPFNQNEIDRVLGMMWAIALAENFDLQMRQINQPLTRLQGSELAQGLLDSIGIEQNGREAYVEGICRRIFKRGLAEIADIDWATIIGALNHTRMHKQGVAHNHPHSGKGPRSKFAHNVGSRSGKKTANQNFAGTPAVMRTEGQTANAPGDEPLPF